MKGLIHTTILLLLLTVTSAFSQDFAGDMDCRLRDSLVLVEIEQANAGNLWDLSQSMDNWQGVTLSAEGCVTQLNITDNGLTHLPAIIGLLADIESINLAKNIIGGTIPPTIGNLVNLKYLNLADNNLDGPVPDELTTLPNLERLNIEKNNFYEIPAQLGNLSSLIELNLRYNYLTSLPVKIGDLTNLKTLNIAYNPLTSLTSGIGQLVNLEKLYAQQCQLTTLPDEFNNLSNLRGLELSQNRLESLPAGLAQNLSNLSELSLRLNYLTFEHLIPFAGYNFGHQDLIGTPDTIEIVSGDDFTIALNFDDDISDNVYEWFRDGVSIDITTENSLQLADFQAEDGGIYTCRVSNPNVPYYYFISTASLTLYAEGETIEEVIYPGDANADGIVNSSDILVWALAKDNAGLERLGATANWIPQSTTDWTNSVGGVNGKHQDADGSGLVDEADLDIIEVNYQKNTGRHQQSYPASNELKLDPDINSVQSFGGSSGYDITLDLSNAIEGTADIHGLAFTVDFSNVQSVEEYSANIDGSDSWIAPSDVIAVDNFLPKRSDFVITRTDAQNQLGIGNIGTLKVITEDLPSIEVPSFGIVISDIHAIQSDGTILHAEDVFVGSFGGSAGNPEGFTAALEFDVIAYAGTCDTPSSATVNISNGNAPYQYEWSNGDINATAENLTPGNYEVTVTDAFGQSIVGFVVVPNGTPLPEIELQTTPEGQIEIKGINPEVQYLWNGQQNSAVTALTPGEHTLEISNPMGCSKTLSVWVADISTNILLEGAFNPNTQLMNDNLRTLGLIPLSDPYTGRMTTTNSVLQTTGNEAIVDWVLVELYANNQTEKVVSSYPALLRRDGEIVANDGISPIRIAVPEITDYHVVIKHRNHLPVKSAATVTLTQPTVTHDFSLGNDSLQKLLSNGSYAMYAADITGEHTIDGTDKIIWSQRNGMFYQYHEADTNLDGDINGTDKIFWSANNGVFTDIR